MISKITPKINKSGFTLVEMLVSVALFTVTVTISMGSLLVLVDANARAQSVQVAVTNISFALDSMTRQLRTGTDWYCPPGGSTITTGPAPGGIRTGTFDCTDGTSLAFTDTRSGNRYAYEWNGNSIQRKIDTDPFSGLGSWHNVTGQNVRITNLRFVTTGTGNADADQPTVTILVEAEVGDVAGLGTKIEVQTSVTQRKLDL